MVGVKNPVILQDEIDKTRLNVRDDPASALLEVLDFEQTKSFHYQYPLFLYYRIYNILGRIYIYRLIWVGYFHKQ